MLDIKWMNDRTGTRNAFSCQFDWRELLNWTFWSLRRQWLEVDSTFKIINLKTEVSDKTRSSGDNMTSSENLRSFERRVISLSCYSFEVVKLECWQVRCSSQVEERWSDIQWRNLGMGSIRWNYGGNIESMEESSNYGGIMDWDRKWIWILICLYGSDKLLKSSLLCYFGSTDRLGRFRRSLVAFGLIFEWDSLRATSQLASLSIKSLNCLSFLLKETCKQWTPRNNGWKQTKSLNC